MFWFRYNSKHKYIKLFIFFTGERIYAINGLIIENLLSKFAKTKIKFYTYVLLVNSEIREPNA